MFVKVARASDGRELREPASAYGARLYCASPRADGGIGRRARLRAWSGITGWRFESSSAHVRKPRKCGAFFVLGDDRSPERRWGALRDNGATTCTHGWGQSPPRRAMAHEPLLRRRPRALGRALDWRRQATGPPLPDEAEAAEFASIRRRRRAPGARGRGGAAAMASTRTRPGTACASASPSARPRDLRRARLHEPSRRGRGTPSADRVDRARRDRAGARDVRRFWAATSRSASPYLSSGTLVDYESTGASAAADVRLDAAGPYRRGGVRRWMRALTADTEAAGLSRQDGQQRADDPDRRAERGGPPGG